MVVVVMGVSGCGKTTVGRALAERLGGVFHDGDAFHSDANVQKMRSGVPLTEVDRLPWLNVLSTEVTDWLRDSVPHVLACSALTQGSRDILGVSRDNVHLVYLRGSFELVYERMSQREHFMPPVLLKSQFDTLEPPENGLTLDVSAPPGTLVDSVISWLESEPPRSEGRQGPGGV